MVLGKPGSPLSFPQDRRGQRGPERAGTGNGGQRALGKRGLLGTRPGPGGPAASAVLASASGRISSFQGGRSKPVITMATSLPGYLEGMSPQREEQGAAEAACECQALDMEAGRRDTSNRMPCLGSVGRPAHQPSLHLLKVWLGVQHLRSGVWFHVAGDPPSSAALGTSSDS